MTFGEKLYKLRKRHGFSQEALAEKLNTTRQAVSKWENNNGYPETEKIILLTKLFQVSLDDLLMEEREIGAAFDDADRNGEKRCGDKREERDGYYVSRETANGFLLYYRKKFLLVAVACGLILGCNAVSYSSLEPDFYELMVQPFLTTLSIMALLSISFYIILKQNPYRNLRNKELIFSEDVKRELQDEFRKMKKVLLAGIVVCLAVVGINEMYFNYFLSINWETMYLMSEDEMRHGNVFYMILVGVCGFVTVFCAGVYWSYAVLLRNQSEKNI